MTPENAVALWSRFVLAGQRLRHKAPAFWPLVVELVEGAAEPGLLTVEDLHEIGTEAICLALSAPPPAPPPSITPDDALAAWRLVDGEALEVELDRVAWLDPGSLAEIHEWASMVAAARSDTSTVVPPRPPAAEQLLAEAELEAWSEGAGDP